LNQLLVKLKKELKNTEEDFLLIVISEIYGGSRELIVELDKKLHAWGEAAVL